jgi:hypothetical protein
MLNDFAHLRTEKETMINIQLGGCIGHPGNLHIGNREDYNPATIVLGSDLWQTKS